jgi:hypothetical protein
MLVPTDTVNAVDSTAFSSLLIIVSNDVGGKLGLLVV